MLIVPELQKVFILVPRTGSGTLYREMKRVYPKAMLLYRHMEADGCPRGYDRWERIGFVRHPLMRLWSLYHFMRVFVGGAQVQHSADVLRILNQVDRPFDDWLLNNTEPWTIPYDLSGQNDFWPVLERTHPAPETRLSQWSYLRPDLGTKVLKFQNLQKHMAEWGLDPTALANATSKSRPPVTVNDDIVEHLNRFCKWDIEQNCELV